MCLHESGVSEQHPEMKKAVDWLISKESRFRCDWQYKNPAKVEASGWAFEYENKWNPDVDDTAMVLLALRKVPTDNPRRRDDCFKRGLDWTMTFQCKDGGWGALDKECTENVLEGHGSAAANEMLGPVWADSTVRIPELLGYEGGGVYHL